MLSRIAKDACIATGLYQPARWLYRNLIARNRIRFFKAECALYSQFLGADDLCFDVGANIGEKSEVFLALGARVLAIEPQLACHREFNARCGLTHRATLVSTAVGAHDGEALLRIDRRNSGATSLNPEWSDDVEAQYTVPVTTLDNMFRKHGIPRFIKIDVEGYELEVLRGMSRRIDGLSFEYHLWETDIVKVAKCLEHLSQFGTLEVNYVGAAMDSLGLQRWLSKDCFIQFFLNELPRFEGCYYGDVFVRYAEDEPR